MALPSGERHAHIWWHQWQWFSVVALYSRLVVWWVQSYSRGAKICVFAKISPFQRYPVMIQWYVWLWLLIHFTVTDHICEPTQTIWKSDYFYFLFVIPPLKVVKSYIWELTVLQKLDSILELAYIDIQLSKHLSVSATVTCCAWWMKWGSADLIVCLTFKLDHLVSEVSRLKFSHLVFLLNRPVRPNLYGLYHL